ncbi:helix-turn-helix transcriptional regulator [Leifsonia xyli]|uniref:helix-turn-helix transcriptional regulator n=1 Tax=Leifsonia xyli TaxID=1575 RepID=UPI003D677019
MTPDETTGEESHTILDPRRDSSQLPVLVAHTAARSGWQAAAAVIEQHWDSFAAVAPDQLLAALKALPGQAFVEVPGLLVAANYLQQASIHDDPTRFFTDGRLTQATPENDEASLSNLILLTGESAAARTSGRLAIARATAEHARDSLNALPSAERAPMAGSLPHLRFQWGRSLDAADAPGTLAEYEEAYELAHLTQQNVIARRAAGHIAWHHAERGRLRQAELWLARAHAEPATNGRYDVIVFLTSALIRHDHEDPGAAHDLGRALGLPLGEQWAAALWISAMIQHTRPGASSVHAHLEAALQSHPEDRSPTGANQRYVTAARARLARLRPGLKIDRSLPDSPSALDHLLAGVDACQKGRYTTALAHCDAASAMSAAPRLEAPALLVAAASHLALGHRETAADTFRHANAIIDRERLLSAYSFIPTTTVATLAVLAGEPIHSRNHATASTQLIPRLSRREREILALLPSGMPMPRIADELYISPNTLKATVRALYRKLGVSSRQAAVDATRHLTRDSPPDQH